MQPAPLKSLADGAKIPLLGFGTWTLDDAEAKTAVASALGVGYRLVDTASRYGNEVGVGRGLRESQVPRSELYVITKLRGADHGYDRTLLAFEQSLRRLALDTVDLYLIHWPLPAKDLYVESWRAFIRLRDEGRVRWIGVSNFEPHHIERLVAETGVQPVVNQIEIHPAFPQMPLSRWLSERGIAVESWSPLGRGDALREPIVEALARKHQKSPAQIILRWHVQRGLIPIPKSRSSAGERAWGPGPARFREFAMGGRD